MIEPRKLTDKERVCWLQLSRTENIGPITFKNLLQKFGSAELAIAALPDMSRKGVQPRLYSRSAAEDEFASANKIGARFVAAGELGYPVDLRHIHAAPPLLCVAGKLEFASRPAIAVIGARNASALGLRFTRMIVERLIQHDLLVVSGLARGIDTAAHEASIDGHATAVVAGGLDYFYPPENEKLQRRIASEGLLISEMTPGTAPKAEHFPRRNRIISGMARATVVVEAALRSGSLITARYANEQGREVFAVPGSPLDPRAQGCNKLIKDGANILTGIDDLLEVINVPGYSQQDIFLELETLPDEDGEPSDDDRVRVLSLVSASPTPIDDIVRESGLSPGMVAGILLELAVTGQIEQMVGNCVSLNG